MKRRTVLAVLALLAVGLVLGSTGSTEAAQRKTFRQVYTCSYASTSGTTSLDATVNAGHWTFYDDFAEDPCDSELLETWHRTTGGFNATFRWYAGATLVKKVTKHLPNNGESYGQTSLTKSGLRHGAHGTWKLHGDTVKLKITMTKAGYTTRSVYVTKFWQY